MSGHARRLYRVALSATDRRPVLAHRALDPRQRRRYLLAVDLPRQCHHPLWHDAGEPHRRSGHPGRCLQLADQRKPRRQGQRDYLRICRGRFRQRRPPAGPRAQSLGPRPCRQPLSEARQIRQYAADLGAARPFKTILAVRGGVRLWRGPRDAACRRRRWSSIRRGLAGHHAALAGAAGSVLALSLRF